MRASFFSPSDDADADSWERQRDVFDQEALHIATKLLVSDDEARRTSIADAVARELFWLIPRDRGGRDFGARTQGDGEAGRARLGGRAVTKFWTLQLAYDACFGAIVTASAGSPPPGEEAGRRPDEGGPGRGSVPDFPRPATGNRRFRHDTRRRPYSSHRRARSRPNPPTRRRSAPSPTPSGPTSCG